MIIFETISYKNFFSIGNFPITVDLTQHSGTLIVGKNGAGKSTFLSAICYALYGQSYKDVLKGSIINSINKKDLLVEIKFKIGSDSYHIKRGMKPNIFEIYMNDKLLNIDGIGGDYQSYLEKNILKMSFHTFKQIVVIGNSGFTPFLKLPAGQRREMIENILDLDIFTKMNSLLKDELQNFNKKKEEIERNIFETDVKLKSEDSKLKFILEKNNSEIEEKRNKVIEAKNEKELLYGKIPAEFEDYETKLSELNSNVRKIELKETQSRTELTFLKKEMELLDCATCPTCKQEIGNDFKLARLETIKKTTEEKNELISKIAKAKIAISEKITDLNEKIKKKTQLVNKKDQLKFEIGLLEKELTKLETPNQDLDEIKKIEKDKEFLSSELEKIENEKSENIKEIDLRKVALNILKDNGVKSKIIRTYIPLINQFINEYLEEMNFYVSFEIDENFKETIKSRHRDVFTYENFSDGEKARIDLAFLFTWRKISRLRNGISTNLLILDEVFSGSLDSSGIDDLNLILRNLQDSNVFVITHRLEGVVDKFESIIEFVKEKNFTQITRNANDIQFN